MERNIQYLLTVATQMILVAVLTVLNTACSGGGSGGSGSTTATVPPVTTCTTNCSTTGTGAVTLTFQQEALNEYVGWDTNNPTNLQATIALTQLDTIAIGGGNYDYEYGGTITISFTDGSNSYSDSFSSNLQSGPNVESNNIQNNQYNLVSTDYPGMGGQPAFHAFFQGTTYCNGYPLPAGTVCPGDIFGGAVILVINSMGLSPDGEGATTGSGSIWFYNFTAGQGTGPLPGTSCWFIYTGPYGCRTWIDGNGVNTFAAIYPNSNYTELGTFTNLDLETAFGGTLYTGTP